MTTLHSAKSIRRSPLRHGLLLITLFLACLPILQAPQASAVTPAPDGGYAGGNTAEGTDALFDCTTGNWNTALGYNALYHDTIGSSNTAVGFNALLSNGNGHHNTASGTQALESNGNGQSDTATGAQALQSNTGGSYNTANGAAALYHNTTGLRNTATGDHALYSNSQPPGHVGYASDNTADGYQALYSSDKAVGNTAVGSRALYSYTFNGGIPDVPGFNTAVGLEALFRDTTGAANTALGAGACYGVTGAYNTAIGYYALSNNSTGSGNTVLGNSAGYGVTTASGVICIGAGGADVDNSCFIGNIRGVTTQRNDAMPVLIDSAGQLGTVNSSRRYKTDIEPIGKASESILALKPMSFRYKVHKGMTPQFGLIAEEVAKVNPDLVIYDADGKPYSVRYDQVNAMLLNEFLKEHRKVEKQETTISQLRSTMAQQQKDFQATVAQLTARLDEQASQIQKVSALLEVNKPTPQIVSSNQ